MGRRNRKPVIGLLGGIGAGKSTVAAELSKLGCAVVDADAIGHELLSDPSVKAELRRLWGKAVFAPNGEVDRAAVAERVFEDAEALAALNAVMHPRMGRRLAEEIDRRLDRPDVPAVVLDAALLLETDWHEQCSHFVFVSAGESERLRRVARSRGWDRSAWASREKSQISLDIKAGKADHVLENSSSLPCLRGQVRKIFHQIVGAAGRCES